MPIPFAAAATAVLNSIGVLDFVLGREDTKNTDAQLSEISSQIETLGAQVLALSTAEVDTARDGLRNLANLSPTQQELQKLIIIDNANSGLNGVISQTAAKISAEATPQELVGAIAALNYAILTRISVASELEGGVLVPIGLKEKALQVREQISDAVGHLRTVVDDNYSSGVTNLTAPVVGIPFIREGKDGIVDVTVESDVTGLKEVEKFEVSILEIAGAAFSSSFVKTLSKYPIAVATGVSQLKEKDLDALSEDGIKQFASDLFTLSQTFGSNANDTLSFTSGSNVLFDGEGGLDTVTVSGNRADFSISFEQNGDAKISGTAIGTDTLRDIEIVSFSDGFVRVDIDDVAGQAYRIYKAAFARTPDNDGLKFWIGQMDSGATLNSVAAGFTQSAEFKSVYGTNPTSLAIVQKFYQNVLGRDGEAGGVSFWTGEIDSGRRPIENVLAGFSESPENIVGVAPTISDGIFLV